MTPTRSASSKRDTAGTTSADSGELLRLDSVVKVFARRLSLGEHIAARFGARVETRGVVAVNDVSISIERGETLGLVGESGCGKSTLGRIAAGILTPTTGVATIDGKAVRDAGAKTTTRIQTVFQDPFASLDPRLRVGDTVAEGPVAHGLVTRRDAPGYVDGWLHRVGLEVGVANRYPHQFSGGQRQRIAIARALAMQPDILVCDEPVASLDVSIQAQIVNLFLALRRELSLTLLFISHDLGVVHHIADRVAIMYLGRIVETGPTATVYEAPAHPYTRALLDSVPRLVVDADVPVAFRPIAGEVPSPLAPPAGCGFHPRCPVAIDACRSVSPVLETRGEGRFAACHLDTDS